MRIGEVARSGDRTVRGKRQDNKPRFVILALACFPAYLFAQGNASTLTIKSREQSMQKLFFPRFGCAISQQTTPYRLAIGGKYRFHMHFHCQGCFFRLSSFDSIENGFVLFGGSEYGAGSATRHNLDRPALQVENAGNRLGEKEIMGGLSYSTATLC
jgi:hypothetical protein